MKGRILLLLVFCCCVFTGSAQKSIKGKVYDAGTKEPLAFASLTATDASTTTSTSGTFSLNTTADTLLVSLIGYESRKLPVATAGSVNIALQPVAGMMEDVIVTASREKQSRTEAPIAISKLTAQLVNETKAVALPELISKVPGVFMMRFTGEGHNMSIRQPLSTSAYFLFMEDGVPVRPMGLFNHNGLIETNIMAVHSIEVVKGPVSSIYGPEAVGGAINLLTKGPTAVPTFSIGLQGDQFNYQRLQFGGGGMAGKKFGLFAGGFIARQKNGWRERTDYEKHALNLKAEYSLSQKTMLTGAFAYNYYDGEEGLSVDSTAFYNRTYEASNDFMYRKILAVRSRISIQHQWNKNADLMVTAFHRFNDYRMSPNHTVRWTSGSATATSEKNQSVFNSYGVIAQHTQRFAFKQSKLILGGTFDYTPQQYDAHRIDLTTQLRPDGLSVKKYLFKQDRPEIFFANYDAKVRNASLYAQADIKATRRLRLSGGARFDALSYDYRNYLDTTAGTRSYQQFSPKIGATYDLGKGYGLYANYSLGFAPPGVTAIFRRRPNVQHGESPFYYNLKPASFTNMEVGGWASLLRNKLSVDVSIYRLMGRNELLSIRQPDNSTDFQSAGQTLHQGVEYGLTYIPGAQWHIRIGGAYALHRFEDFQLSTRPSDPVKKLDGFEMPSAPGLTSNAEVIYTPKWLTGLRLSAEWQYLSPWYINQINTFRYDDKGFMGFRGMSVLNARINYTWKGLELFASVLNATNELYAVSLGRGNGVNDRTNFQPGAPRTVGFGVQYNFTGRQKE